MNSEWLTQFTYAHRGLHDGVTVIENSRSACDAALARDLGIECDVQLSRDAIPMVFHDWELDRLTKGRGSFAKKTTAELAQLKLGQTDDAIWCLADLLDCIGGQVPVLIEIKSRPDIKIADACSAVLRVIDQYRGPLAVMSFDLRVGEWFARHAPRFLRGLVTTDTYDHGYIHAWRRPHTLERSEPDFLASDRRDLPNILAQLWRESGRPLLAWTVRNLDQKRDVCKQADALIAEGEALE